MAEGREQLIKVSCTFAITDPDSHKGYRIQPTSCCACEPIQVLLLSQQRLSVTAQVVKRRGKAPGWLAGLLTMYMGMDMRTRQIRKTAFSRFSRNFRRSSAAARR